MNSAGRKSLSVSVLPGEFVHVSFLLQLKSIVPRQDSHDTGITQTKSRIQNPLPFQALLGEITVICRQKPQVTTYNHCQVYTATLLSFFKPFSFLSTEQQCCSTMQVKSFTGMGQNFGFLWHSNIVWSSHQLPNSFCWTFGGWFSKVLNSDASRLLFKGAVKLALTLVRPNKINVMQSS